MARGLRWTYAQLDEAVGRAARVLLDRECRVGERVAALAKNRAELLMLHLACARIGAIYVPLNWRLSPPELAFLTEDADPRLVVGDGELARAGVSGVALDDLADEIEAAQPLEAEPIDRTRPSLILYTSGTTGKPKGVLLTEGNLDQTAFNFGRLARATHDSVFMSDAPMFHIIGLVTGVRAPLMHGAALLISEGFEPGRTLARLGDPALGVTHYFAVPQMAAVLRAHPDYDPERLRGLTGVFSGGAPHPAAAIRAWLDDGLAIVDGFGMSEAGTVTCMPIALDRIRARAGSTGVAMPGVQMRVIDEEGGEQGPGQSGELLLRGANIFSGYWRRPEDTARAFTRDGWFRTGDVAVLDAEGFLTLVDRKKDMFISGGENVYPAEIEAALADHPDIAECAVVGLPDERWGESGCLAVLPRAGASVAHPEILAHLAPRLARYKLPTSTLTVDALPRTASGKVRKDVLKLQLSSMRSPLDGGPAGAEGRRLLVEEPQA